MVEKIHIKNVEIVSRNNSAYILIPQAIVKSFNLKVGDSVSYFLCVGSDVEEVFSMPTNNHPFECCSSSSLSSIKSKKVLK